MDTVEPDPTVQTKASVDEAIDVRDNKQRVTEFVLNDKIRKIIDIKTVSKLIADILIYENKNKCKIVNICRIGMKTIQCTFDNDMVHEMDIDIFEIYQHQYLTDSAFSDVAWDSYRRSIGE